MTRSTGKPRASERGPFLNMRFRVEIEGIEATGCTEVLLPESRLDGAGAAPDAKPTLRLGTLVLRRGLSGSPLWFDWWQRATRPRLKSARSVTVVLLDERGADANRWVFGGARPCAYHVSSLNALGAEVVIETLELTVESLQADYGLR
ncbi:phage tail protein [Rivibacter subsaxonicus]|uniref:Phage tail-like protein n=1 Tax=Rivibacter subsaxonicus TaxID=457575 RepID=A0A4Q7VAX7_9BURK|nr:phage tail protein [Rivibacter subsaxonicus]RZT92493.1 phage tail-like protein [Rivibacter subsaxonicus]